MFSEIAKTYSLGPIIDIVHQTNWQIQIDATRSNVSSVHTGTADSLIELVEFFTLLKEPEKGVHRAQIKRTTTNKNGVIQNTSDLGEHGTNVLGTKWNVDTAQLLNGKGVTLLINHHGAVVQAIKVGQGLKKC